MLTHLDLFTGIGGFTIAAQRAGFSTIGFSETDDYASRVLRKHWPHIHNWGDIRNVIGLRANLVTGGFPCQPYSFAGKRRGEEDHRALWPDMLAVIERSRCDYVLAENVPGIIGMELDRVLSDLESLGYTTGTIIVPACAVDARHRRDRVWIMAHANNGGRSGNELKAAGSSACGPVFPDSASRGWSTRKRQDDERKPDAIGGGPTHANGQCERLQGQLEVGPAPGAIDGSRNGRDPCVWPVEPGICRVVDGIPNRAHRLRCLGNAIVPQVAEILLRAMIKL